MIKQIKFWIKINIMNSKRIENKYILDGRSKHRIVNKILNSGYFEIYEQRNIESIYYDNLKLQSFYDSDEGNIPRKKIRIRSYDGFKSDFNYEIKEVNANGRFKSVKKVLSLPEKCIDDIYKVMYPLVIIRYKRKYFTNNFIRLTLDWEINYQKFKSNKIYKSPNLVLESKLSDGIKYNEEINNLKVFGLNNVSFSKYKEAVNLSTHLNQI
tara:strand:- start:8275 stop:8907 length:633 start_codon:yes stop_codon:yes gene_type:complete